MSRYRFELATPADDACDELVALATVDTSRMLLLDEGHCFRDQALAACGLTADRTKTFAATSLSTIVEFVANGQGITLLPEIALRKETAGDRIHIHRLASPGAGRMLSLVWRERGGPPVDGPERHGFGLTLIERGLAYQLGGSAVLEFRHYGLRCTIEFALEPRVPAATRPWLVENGFDGAG